MRLSVLESDKKLSDVAHTLFPKSERRGTSLVLQDLCLKLTDAFISKPETVCVGGYYADSFVIWMD